MRHIHRAGLSIVPNALPREHRRTVRSRRPNDAYGGRIVVHLVSRLAILLTETGHSRMNWGHLRQRRRATHRRSDTSSATTIARDCMRRLASRRWLTTSPARRNSPAAVDTPGTRARRAMACLLYTSSGERCVRLKADELRPSFAGRSGGRGGCHLRESDRLESCRAVFACGLSRDLLLRLSCDDTRSVGSRAERAAPQQFVTGTRPGPGPDFLVQRAAPPAGRRSRLNERRGPRTMYSRSSAPTPPSSCGLRPADRTPR